MKVASMMIEVLILCMILGVMIELLVVVYDNASLTNNKHPQHVFESECAIECWLEIHQP